MTKEKTKHFWKRPHHLSFVKGLVVGFLLGIACMILGANLL